MGRRRSSPSPARRRRVPRPVPKDLCPLHPSPNEWTVICAILSQMLVAGVALWHCIPDAPQTAVRALIRGFFLHLRVVQSAVTGERRVLFTDIMRSFDMGNTGWKVHLARRFPDARKIYVQDGDKTPGEYVSLSLFDFGQFVSWANGQRTDVNPARDKSIRTTFQKDEPQHVAARAFMQQVNDLLFAFGQLHPAPAPSAPQPPPSLVSFLLGHQYIREATFSRAGLCEINADRSLGAPLALTALQLELQLTRPEKKKQAQKAKADAEKVNEERKKQGKGPLRIRQSKATERKVKAVQVGPQIGKKKGRGQQRERAPPAVVEVVQEDDEEDVAVMAEDEVKDDEQSEDEGEEKEDEEDEDNYLPPPPQSPTSDEPQPLRDTTKAPEHSGPAGYVLASDLPSPLFTGAYDLFEPLPPHSPLPDNLEFDDGALGQMHPSAFHGDAMAVHDA